MGTIPEKQMRDEELHNYPFDAEIFREAFNGYIRKLNITFTILVLVISTAIMARAIASYLELTGIDISGFLRLWHAGASFLSDLGFSHINELVSSGIISFGVISVGGIVSFGTVSIGGGGSCGLISIGGVGSCGTIAIGGQFAAGLIAISSANAYGLVAISTGYKPFIGADQYTSGKAVGLIAIGRHASGGYALSYDDNSESTYLLSPERQDPEAVAFFTRFFRKFKGAFVGLP